MMNSLNFLLYKLSFLEILNSPFKWFRVGIYFGNITMGIPYFLPRRWVKYNKKELLEESIQKLAKDANIILTENVNITLAGAVRDFKRYYKAIPKKFGIDIVALGWKTKYDEYRFEFPPMISIVAFGKQLVIYFGPKSDINDDYWTAWLYYKYETDKKLSKTERTKQLITNFLLYTNPETGKVTISKNCINILKKKYHKLIPYVNGI